MRPKANQPYQIKHITRPSDASRKAAAINQARLMDWLRRNGKSELIPYFEKFDLDEITYRRKTLK